MLRAWRWRWADQPETWQGTYPTLAVLKDAFGWDGWSVQPNGERHKIMTSRKMGLEFSRAVIIQEVRDV